MAYTGAMEHPDIIRALGGPTALARSLGIERTAVALHWPRRGIPSSLWHEVVELAEKQGIPVTFALLKATKPTLRKPSPLAEAA